MDGNEKEPTLERKPGVSEFMKLWYAVFWTSAWGFAAGVEMFLIDFFRLAKAKAQLCFGAMTGWSLADSSLI